MLKHLTLLAFLCLTLPSFAQKDIQLNLQNADLREFVETVAKITGKNFVMSPGVQGSVTIISPEKFNKQALYDIFLNVLAVNGFSATKGSGGVIKIAPDGGQPFIGYDAVSQVHQLGYVNAKQIVPTLKPLLPAGTHITADDKNNLLILSGQAGDVARAVNIIKRIDQNSGGDYDVIRLRNASANDVARSVNSLIGGENSRVKIVADERTNSILLQAPKDSKLRVKALITHLDTPIENAGNTEVLYLKNANAVNVAKTLSTAKSTIVQNAEADGQTIDMTQSAQQDGVDIRADESTNSLIITAPPATMRNLKQVIAKLDIRRSQVLVEAIIAEVSLNDMKNLGVQWYAAGSNGTIPVGVIDFNNTGSSILGLAANYYAQQGQRRGNAAIDTSAVANGATFGIGNKHAGVLINALNSLKNTNILSTPSLLVMDNEEAEFLVGENIPYVTGSYTTNSSGSSNPFQTVEREDVGVKLNIKPQISEGNTIALDIYQEVSNVTSTDAQLGPTTAKRALKTSVLVDNDQVLVLGGLTNSQQGSDEQKVPVLGDIPVMGNLFKSRAKTDKKRNLMIFIRPQILRNQRRANFATQEKYDHIRQAQLNHPLTTPQSTLPAIDLTEKYQANSQAPAPIYERSRALKP
ncbi:MAG: type II secretion system protein GspD [Gammaproteobacteria bacterium]|nr:MAG: type II secretion system protein GspD [Gammaproteobacteria bacterium]